MKTFQNNLIGICLLFLLSLSTSLSQAQISNLTLIPENYSGTPLFTGVSGSSMTSNNGYPYDYYEMQEYNGYLYYAAFTADEGLELWRTDGNTAELFMDIRTGTEDGIPRSFYVWNGYLYFRAITPVGNKSLWRTDGTVAGTQQVFYETCCGATTKSTYGELNGKLYLSGFSKLIEVDASGTVSYVDDGSGSSAIFKPSLVASNGAFLYIITELTNQPSFTGQKFLFSSNGTETGLTWVHSFGTNYAQGETREPSQGNDADHFPPYYDEYMVVNGNLVFVSDLEGGTLYASAGGAGDVEELDASLSGVENLTRYGNEMHFNANGDYESIGLPYQQDIWRTSGSLGGPFATGGTHMENAMAFIPASGKVPEDASIYYCMKTNSYTVQGETVYRSNISQKGVLGYNTAIGNTIPPAESISLAVEGFSSDFLFYWKRTGNSTSGYQSVIETKKTITTQIYPISGPQLPTSDIGDVRTINGVIIMPVNSSTTGGITKLWRMGDVDACNEPVADFYPGDTSYEGLTVYFSNMSMSDTGGTPSWDFDDGNTSSDEFPMHTYASTGTYNVCLIYTDDCAADTICKTLTITEPCVPPTADFTYTQVEPLFPDVQFTNNSLEGETYLWDFGDGTTSTEENPIHTFPSIGTFNGTYTVCLTTNNLCGTDNICMTINVPCTGNFTPDFTSSQPDPSTPTIQFINTTATSHPDDTYSWDFGDGNTSTEENPTHTYAAEGDYDICFVIVRGCLNTGLCNVEINVSDCDYAVGNYSYVQNNPEVPGINFTNLSTDFETVFWDFGDGMTASGDSPYHAYPTAGTYTACVEVIGSCNVWDIFCMDIVVTNNNDLYVDQSATGNNSGSSWMNAFTDLQSALAIGENRIIHIAEGTYYPASGTFRAGAFDIPQGATLLGGYPAGGGTRDYQVYPTRLSGDIDGDNTLAGNSYHVVRILNASNIDLDGIYISDGYADVEQSYGRSRGAGIYTKNAVFSAVDCVIENNASIYGAGIFATQCPTIVFDKVLIRQNTANNGSAIYHSNETVFILRRSKVLDNNSLVRCAIEVNNSTNTVIDQSVIANNASANANAIGLIATNRDQIFFMYNSTVIGHDADKSLMTLQVGFGDELSVDIESSIIGHQNPSFTKGIKTFVNGTLNLSTDFCYIQGSSVEGMATNNLYSATAGDLMLNSNYSVNECSPVVDAGSNDYMMNEDIDGNPGGFNGIMDIGAYESQTTCSSSRLSFQEEEKENTILDIEIYPNPTTNWVNIERQIDTGLPMFIQVFDAQGKMIQQLESQNSIERIDLSSLPNGLYYFHISQGEQQKTFPISKLR